MQHFDDAYGTKAAVKAAGAHYGKFGSVVGSIITLVMFALCLSVTGGQIPFFSWIMVGSVGAILGGSVGAAIGAFSAAGIIKRVRVA